MKGSELLHMIVKDKIEQKYDRLKEQFGCGYYSVCCRGNCPCNFKFQEYDPDTMIMLKKEYDRKTEELFR